METATLSIELRYLLYLCLWLLALWIPYVLAHVARIGLVHVLAYPPGRRDMPEWAHRLKEAHYNLVENMVPFAVVVIAGEIRDAHTATTAACALVFLIARLIHPFAQLSGVFGLRTLAFAVGWMAVMVYLAAVLGWA